MIGVGSQRAKVRAPSLKQRHIERLAFQTVYRRALDGLAVVVPAAVDHHEVAVGRAEQIGHTAMHTDLTGGFEIHAAVIGLDGIVVIPVACGYDLSAGHLNAADVHPLSVETAEAVEGVTRRVVHFRLNGLPHAEVLFVTACQQHLAVAKRHAQTVVVVVGHLHHMPLPVLQIFSRWRGNETGGMTASHRQFTASIEGCMAKTGDVQVGQALGYYFYKRTAVDGTCRLCRFLSRRNCCQQQQLKQCQQYRLMLHVGHRLAFSNFVQRYAKNAVYNSQIIKNNLHFIIWQ